MVIKTHEHALQKLFYPGIQKFGVSVRLHDNP